MYRVTCFNTFFSLFLLSYSVVYAQNLSKHCDSTLEHPCLVQDTKTNNSPIKLLRDVTTISDVYNGNTQGLTALFMSGSEAPSERGWAQIADYLGKKNPSSVWVLDLRQESHGYLNGSAVTLVSWFNWINLGKDNEQSMLDQDNWLKKLSAKKKVTGVLTVQQYQDKEYANGAEVEIHSVENEAHLISKLGFKYSRLFLTDHRPPRDSEVDAFLKFINALPPNTWLHIHCRGGKGRTTTIMAMYDMLKNADKVSFEEIIARQASIFPYYNLLDLSHRNPTLTPYYEKRITFLRYFYEFSKQVLLGYTDTWSEWRIHNFEDYPEETM